MEIPLTAVLPALLGRKAPPGGEFLRFQLRTTVLGSQLIFLPGTKDEGWGGTRRFVGGCVLFGGHWCEKLEPENLFWNGI